MWCEVVAAAAAVMPWGEYKLGGEGKVSFMRVGLHLSFVPACSLPLSSCDSSGVTMFALILVLVIKTRGRSLL